MTPTRVLNFIRRYRRHPLYILVYGFLYFLPGFRIRTHIYNEEEVRALLTSGKSVIRLGDGEVNVLLGLRNHYQDFSPKLRGMVRDIVSGYGPLSPYVLAVPRAITIRNDELREMQRFNVWLPFKTLFLLLLPKRMSYMDAHCFYYDGYIERVMVPALRNKRIVLITNIKTIEKQRANPRLPWKDMQYIEAPGDNLLKAYDDIVHAIDTSLEHFSDGTPPVLLFAIGPAGKHLIKRYAELGHQSIDIGRGAEVMFTDESIEQLI